MAFTTASQFLFILHAFSAMAYPVIMSTPSPENSRNLTVYHLNPESAGALPINMDTGDVGGDLYFYLGEFLLPLECANIGPHTRSQFDCHNAERSGKNLVVTKVDLQIDTQTVKYSACNLCNGTDPFKGTPCKEGTYVCDCESFDGHDGPCDSTKVGIQNITQSFAPTPLSAQCSSALTSLCGAFSHDEKHCPICLKTHALKLQEQGCNRKDLFLYCPSSFSCNADSPKWACWADNIPRKTAGMWYSTLAAGQCKPGATNCSWAVQSVTTVKEECLKDRLMTTVESHNTACFHACGARNITSSCWISCFFGTVLGSDAASSTALPLGGIDISVLEKSWEGSFLPKAQGGCDTVTM